MKQGSFAPAKLCCLDHPHYYDPLGLPLDYRPLHGSAAIDRCCSRPRRDGAEEGLPSSQDNLLTVPRPLRREVPPHPLQAPKCVPWPSPCSSRLGSSLAVNDGEHLRRRRLRLMLRTDQLIHPASHPASRRRTGASLPGTLASPWTGLPPVGCPELVDRFRINHLAPDLLGALEPMFASGADGRAFHALRG